MVFTSWSMFLQLQIAPWCWKLPPKRAQKGSPWNTNHLPCSGNVRSGTSIIGRIWEGFVFRMPFSWPGEYGGFSTLRCVFFLFGIWSLRICFSDLKWSRKRRCSSFCCVDDSQFSQKAAEQLTLCTPSMKPVQTRSVRCLVSKKRPTKIRGKGWKDSSHRSFRVAFSLMISSCHEVQG